MPNSGLLQKDVDRIAERVRQIDAAGDPNARSAAVELVQLLMDMHGSGIARMLRIISRTGAAGSDIIDRCGKDDIVGQLLTLYSLHPVNLETRVKNALEKVRPALKSHGGDVELLSVDDGVVKLRLDGSCNGCPSSSQTLKNLIEEAINESAGDIAGLEVLGVVKESVPTQMVQLGHVAL